MFSIKGETWMVSPEVTGKLALGTWYRYIAQGKTDPPNPLVSRIDDGSSSMPMRNWSLSTITVRADRPANPTKTPLPMKLPGRSAGLAFVGERKKARAKKFAADGGNGRAGHGTCGEG